MNAVLGPIWKPDRLTARIAKARSLLDLAGEDEPSVRQELDDIVRRLDALTKEIR